MACCIFFLFKYILKITKYMPYFLFQSNTMMANTGTSSHWAKWEEAIVCTNK